MDAAQWWGDPVIVGTILYHPFNDRATPEEIPVTGHSDGSHSIECYGCGRRYRLNPLARVLDERIIPGHRVTVKRNGRVMVSAPILCRNRSCGWYVVVDANGVARDIPHEIFSDLREVAG